MTAEAKHRIELHWKCLLQRPSHLIWHLRGIARELFNL